MNTTSNREQTWSLGRARIQLSDPMGRRYDVLLYEVHPEHWEYELKHNGLLFDSIECDNGVQAQWFTNMETAAEAAQSVLDEIKSNAAYNIEFQRMRERSYERQMQLVWLEMRARALMVWSRLNPTHPLADAVLTGRIHTWGGKPSSDYFSRDEWNNFVLHRHALNTPA